MCFAIRLDLYIYILDILMGLQDQVKESSLSMQLKKHIPVSPIVVAEEAQEQT
jgi:hypothetical protein